MAAIYQWYVNKELLLTTTLYPIDTAESVVISVSISAGSMNEIPVDYVESTFSLQSIDYTQVRWFYDTGPHEDEVETTFSLESITYTQVRWFYETGPHEDEVETTFSLISIDYVKVAIAAETEIEGLQPTMTISASSTMTAV